MKAQRGRAMSRNLCGQAAGRRFYLALAFMVLGAGISTAQPPVEIDLATALNLALHYNPALGQARERLREQEGRSMAVGSVRWPHLELAGDYTTEDDNRLESFGPDSDPDDYGWTAGVQFTQPLYGGGRLLARVRTQRALTSAIEAQALAVQINVLTDVHRKFYDALLARERIAVQEESLALLEQQLKLAQNRFDAGAGARFDVLQAEVRVANARPPLLRAQNDYRLALEDLRNTLGISADEGFDGGTVRLVGDFEGSGNAPAMDDALREAAEHRPELRQAQFETGAAEHQLRETTRQSWPVLNLFGDYSYSHNRYGSDPDPLEGWRVGVAASIPIWEGGRIRGETIEARSRLEQNRLREEETRLAVELEVRQAIHNLDVAREILDASERVIEQAREALRLAENRYRVGELTQLDVLASQLDLTQAKLDRITAARDYRVQRVVLDRAIGRIPGADLIDPPTE